MSDFWTRKKEELQAKGELPSPRRSEPISGPWWADGTSLLQQRQNEPQNQPESRPGASESRPGTVDGHDVSKASHLKASSECPRCQSNDFMKVSSSTAPRCFSCGYVGGRQLNDENLMTGIIDPSSVATLKVRQTADGGSSRDARHMGGSVADIAHNNAILEQSSQGKANVG